jgi:hypothetical protein
MRLVNASFIRLSRHQLLTDAVTLKDGSPTTTISVIRELGRNANFQLV